MLIIILIIIVVESTSGTEVDKLPSAMNQEKGVQVSPEANGKTPKPS